MSIYYLLDILVEKNSPRLQFEVFDSLRAQWRAKWQGPGANCISVETTEMGAKMVLEILAMRSYKVHPLAHVKDSTTEVLLVLAEATPTVLQRLNMSAADLEQWWIRNAD